MTLNRRLGPSVVSLFSGAGGLDVAAHMAGFETLAAIELERKYCDSLIANQRLSNMSLVEFDSWLDKQLPKMGRMSEEQARLLRNRLEPAVGRPNGLSSAQIIESDIGTVNAVDLLASVGLKPGELDLLIGGPPCQSFSKAGQRMSLEDLRGQLFLQFARFVNECRPRWFLFENVKGLTNSHALVVKILCDGCGEAVPKHTDVQSDPDKAKYACSRCGRLSPVLSRRMETHGALDIILAEFESLGYSCRYAVLDAADYGVPQFRERLFIIGSRDSEDIQFPDATRSKRSNDQLGLFASHGGEPQATVWDALFKDPNPYHPGPLDPEKAVLWVKNVVRPHDEPVTWDLRRPSPTVGAHQGAKLAVAPHGVPAEQLFRQQWHTLGRRQSDRPPVPVTHTYLSDEDLLVLQTFPRSWFIAGTRMERAFQIGNAVPPLLGAAVLEHIAHTLGTQSTRGEAHWYASAI